MPAITGARLAAGIRTISPALARIQVVMASPEMAAVVVTAEDVLKILAIFDVPGAAAAEEGVEIAANLGPDLVAAGQILAVVIPTWLSTVSFAAAPNMHPVGRAGSKPTGEW